MTGSSDCIFCRIVRKEIPASLVFEDEETVAFHDLAPKAPVHILVIPKKHIGRLSEAGEADALLIGHSLRTVARVAAAESLSDFRVAVNNGAEAGQTVFHLHFHLLGGRAFTWPPG